MAGIIAQLTRSARERSNKKYYGANKCLYTLERFDPNGFNPLVHNKFVAERNRQARRPLSPRTRIITFIQELDDDGSVDKGSEFSWMTFLLESIMIVTLLGLIPVSFILAEVIFNFGTRYLSPSCLERLYGRDMIVYNCNFTEEENH